MRRSLATFVLGALGFVAAWGCWHLWNDHRDYHRDYHTLMNWANQHAREHAAQVGNGGQK